MIEQYTEKIAQLEYGLYVEQTISQALYEIIILEHSDIDLKTVFRRFGIEKVSIYGMGRVGKSIKELFIRKGIQVVYCVDINQNLEIDDIDLRHDISEMTDDVDIVIVTPEVSYLDIKARIKKVLDCKVILARDLLENVLLLPKALEY